VYRELLGRRETRVLWEHPGKWDLRAPKGPRVTRVPRPHRETGNNVRGRILMMGETMG